MRVLLLGGTAWLADTLTWGEKHRINTVTGAGLTNTEERELLALLH
jgi:hypothetical protein